MENENQSKPLVSVVVFSYNSSVTIVETLDSIKDQTYQQIELIITDDCSKDGTLEIAEKWLMKNHGRFHDVQLIKSSQNTGVSANGNRGCYASHGEWIKVIAADDVLLPHCIERNIEYVCSKTQYDFVFSKEKGIGNMDAYKRWPFKNVHVFFEELSHEEQYILLFQHNFLPTPTVFFRSACFRELGGYDESIPFLEDRPMWLKAYRAHLNMGFLNEYTVAYRFSNTSISQRESTSEKKVLFEDSYKKMMCLAKEHRKMYSIGAWWFDKTYSITSGRKIPFLFINALNPFFYKNRKVIRFFNDFVNYSRTH